MFGTIAVRVAPLGAAFLHVGRNSFVIAMIDMQSLP